MDAQPLSYALFSLHALLPGTEFIGRIDGDALGGKIVLKGRAARMNFEACLGFQFDVRAVAH